LFVVFKNFLLSVSSYSAFKPQECQYLYLVVKILGCKGLELCQLEYGPMPNVMAALPNIGDTLCSMQQSLADAHY